MKNASRALSLAVAGLCSACTSAVAVAPEAPLSLTVRNEAGASLRCVSVLAHFVTVDHPPIAPGAELSVPLHRDAAAGTLSVPRSDGREMMLENLLCGITGQWSQTRAEVPLLPLRADTPARMITTCRMAAPLSCTPPQPADHP